ncbi:MAG: T9SS type A sorting domain-containing protein, partial [Flavobacterium sp.]|nr:T9SS type A sorting domain-containing protein [Flavobacterium sp.]
NLGIDNNLGNFVLQAGTLATAAPQGGCGSKIPMPRSCSYDIYTPTINEYKYFDIPAVVNLLPNKTVQGLFDMANKALGGGALPEGVTLSSLANAVDVINNAFDGCRISMGYNETPLACIEDRASFIVNPVPSLVDPTVTYKFSYVSDVTIEVWNISGVKLHTQLDANSCYDKKVSVNYPFTASGTYIIKLVTNIGSSSRTVIKN